MTVTYEVVRRVAWLTIDRPEARNALSAEVRRLLTEGFTRFAGGPEAAAEAEALWEPVYLSADAQEGPAAFRDGRTPVWQGR